MSRATSRRLASPPFRALVMKRSATLRATRALECVVTTRSSRKSDVTRFRSIASRWLAVRPSFFTFRPCRISAPRLRFRGPAHHRLLRLWLFLHRIHRLLAAACPAAATGAARRGRRTAAAEVLRDVHAEAKVHAAQDVGDLLQRLPPEVPVLEHLRFGLLHQVADRL